MSSKGSIGIVGGGQLGRMLTEAAISMGFQVTVIDPGPNAPAAQVGAAQIVAALDDKAALWQLADQSGVITIEIEHVAAELLSDIAKTGTSVQPAPETISLIQDKLAQKVFLQNAGLPVAPFAKITDRASAINDLEKFDGKMLIKTSHGAYDGRGNMIVESNEDIENAFETFRGRPLYAEKFIPFQKELAIMIARSTTGELATYPVTETIQERNICVEVIAPAAISQSLQEQAKSLALDIMAKLKGAGIFGIEMFLTDDGQILINEIAPRVHNSGHYTIEACATSQFEQHLRAITGLPLASTALVVPAAVMINILGERDGEVTPVGIDKANQKPHTTVHLYGKSPTKVDRKMGHLTSVGDTVEEARERARTAREIISI